MTDTIIGIDQAIQAIQAIQASIFDSFMQIDRGADGSRGGLGIGLALARRLAELHGGCVSIAREGAGRGPTFTVTLPRGTVSAWRPGNGGRGRSGPCGPLTRCRFATCSAAFGRADVLTADDWAVASQEATARAALFQVIDDRAGARPTASRRS